MTGDKRWIEGDNRKEEERKGKIKAGTGSDRECEGLYKVDWRMTRCIVMTESMSRVGGGLHTHIQGGREGDKGVAGEAGREQLEGSQRGRERGRGERERNKQSSHSSQQPV